MVLCDPWCSGDVGDNLGNARPCPNGAADPLWAAATARVLRGNVPNQLFSRCPRDTPGLGLSHTSPLFVLFSTRWQQTSKSLGLSGSLQPAGAKADALREEMDEAANRVEICRVPAPPPLLLLTGTDGGALRESLILHRSCRKTLRVRSGWTELVPRLAHGHPQSQDEP